MGPSTSAISLPLTSAQLIARGGDERLTDLLGRLDAAVAKVIDEDIYTDEINR